MSVDGIKSAKFVLNHVKPSEPNLITADLAIKFDTKKQRDAFETKLLSNPKHKKLFKDMLKSSNPPTLYLTLPLHKEKGVVSIPKKISITF